MAYKIENCKDGDAEYIIDRLVEYNLYQVPPEQITLFDTLDKKITDDNGRIIPVVLRECTVGMSPTLIRCG